MKPDYQSRYNDLLTEPSNKALHKLVQELENAYTAPTRPTDLSWEAAQRQLMLMRNEDSSLRQGQLARVPRGRKGAILLAAAVVAIVLLSGTVLNVVGTLRFQRGQPSGTPFATDAQLLQQLVQDKGTPMNIQQLLQSDQFTAVNLASHTYNLHIQKVYADANNVVLLYTVDMDAWNATTTCDKNSLSSCKTEPVLTLKTATGQILPETAERANMGKQPVYKNKLVALLAYYDISKVQGASSQLMLTATLAKSISPSQERIGTFTAPVHTDKKVLSLHETTSSKGHTLMLERVVLTPTEARFYYSYNKPLASTTDSITSFADETISIAGKTYSPNPFPSDNDVNTYGWFNQGSPEGNYTSFHENLLDQMGTWSFTERAVVNENLSGPPSAGKNIHYAWTFTFTVS